MLWPYILPNLGFLGLSISELCCGKGQTDRRTDGRADRHRCPFSKSAGKYRKFPISQFKKKCKNDRGSEIQTQNPDQSQNLITIFVAKDEPFHLIWFKSVNNFLRCPVLCTDRHGSRIQDRLLLVPRQPFKNIIPISPRLHLLLIFLMSETLYFSMLEQWKNWSWIQIQIRINLKTLNIPPWLTIYAST